MLEIRTQFPIFDLCDPEEDFKLKTCLSQLYPEWAKGAIKHDESPIPVAVKSEPIETKPVVGLKRGPSVGIDDSGHEEEEVRKRAKTPAIMRAAQAGSSQSSKLDRSL